MALQPPPHLLTTLPAPAGGGRCVCHRHPEPSGSVGEPPVGRTRDGLRRGRSPERPSWPRRVLGGPRGLAADVDELGDGEGRGGVVAGHGRGSRAARTSCSARGAMAAAPPAPDQAADAADGDGVLVHRSPREDEPGGRDAGRPVREGRRRRRPPDAAGRGEPGARGPRRAALAEDGGAAVPGGG